MPVWEGGLILMEGGGDLRLDFEGPFTSLRHLLWVFCGQGQGLGLPGNEGGLNAGLDEGMEDKRETYPA